MLGCASFWIPASASLHKEHASAGTQSCTGNTRAVLFSPSPRALVFLSTVAPFGVPQMVTRTLNTSAAFHSTVIYSWFQQDIGTKIYNQIFVQLRWKRAPCLYPSSIRRWATIVPSNCRRYLTSFGIHAPHALAQCLSRLASRPFPMMPGSAWRAWTSGWQRAFPFIWKHPALAFFRWQHRGPHPLFYSSTLQREVFFSKM